MITPKSGGIRSKRPTRERRNVPIPASPHSIPESIHKNLRKATQCCKSSRERTRWRNSRTRRIAQIVNAVAGRVAVENHNGVGWPENTTAQYIQAEPKRAQIRAPRAAPFRWPTLPARNPPPALNRVIHLLHPVVAIASVAQQGMLQAKLASPSFLPTMGARSAPLAPRPQPMFLVNSFLLFSPVRSVSSAPLVLKSLHAQ
jgi:hypothetical protein